jgi:hypothetical protein
MLLDLFCRGKAVALCLPGGRASSCPQPLQDPPAPVPEDV